MSQIQHFRATKTTGAVMIVAFAAALSVVLAAGSSSIQLSAGGPPGPSAEKSPQSGGPAAAATRGEDAGQDEARTIGSPRRQQQTTALIVTATGEPHYAPGSDGRTHIEYDLILTNVTANPVTLTSVQVFNGRGRQLLELQGAALTAVTQPLLGGAPTNQVPASGAVAAVIDLVVPHGEVPTRLTHHITYALDPDTPQINQAGIGSLVIEGPELSVERRGPVVIAPPLSGDGWFNANGCRETRTALPLAVTAPYVTGDLRHRLYSNPGEPRSFIGDGTATRAMPTGRVRSGRRLGVFRPHCRPEEKPSSRRLTSSGRSTSRATRWSCASARGCTPPTFTCSRAASRWGSARRSGRASGWGGWAILVTRRRRTCTSGSRTGRTS